MKMIRNALLMGLATLVMSQAWADDTEAARRDLSRLQSEWSMASGSRDGQKLPDNMLRNSKRVCRGDETTVMVGGQLLMKAKFTLDPSKSPKTIDYRITGGPTAGKAQLGIYELDEETVKFCFSSPGQARPTDFTTKAGDGRTFSVWKRDKK
jgi:uncharacterized protein (TIGR03067 family)